MERREFVAGAGTFAALLALAACDPDTPETSPTTEPEVVELVADYPYYPSARDAAEAATAIVTGTPVSSRFAVEGPLDPGTDDPYLNPQAGAEEVDPADLQVPVTITSVQVTAVIKGEGIAVGDQVEISQLGGLINGVRYVEQGAAYLSSSGSTVEVVAFLSREEPEEGPFHLINSRQALFEITGDDVQPLGGTEGIPGISSVKDIEALA